MQNVLKPNIRTLQYYRRFIKTAMISFDGDPEMFHHVRLEVKKKIYENKDLTEIPDIMKKINEGEEFRNVIRDHLIKGTLQSNGNYRYKIRKEHAVGADKELV